MKRAEHKKKLNETHWEKLERDERKMQMWGKKNNYWILYILEKMGIWFTESEYKSGVITFKLFNLNKNNNGHSGILRDNWSDDVQNFDN